MSCEKLCATVAKRIAAKCCERVHEWKFATKSRIDGITRL